VIEVTPTPVELPVTGNYGGLGTYVGLAPLVAMLLLAIPALIGLRTRLK
jgi:hypothetical protein